MPKNYNYLQNEKIEGLWLVLLALWCFAFGITLGRLGVYYGWWLWISDHLHL